MVTGSTDTATQDADTVAELEELEVGKALAERLAELKRALKEARVYAVFNPEAAKDGPQSPAAITAAVVRIEATPEYEAHLAAEKCREAIMAAVNSGEVTVTLAQLTQAAAALAQDGA